MKRSLSGFIVAAAMAVITMAVDATNGAISATVRIARVASDWFGGLITAPLKLSQAKAGEVQLVPRVTLVRAVAFVERLMQRRRPRLEASWRLCEST